MIWSATDLFSAMAVFLSPSDLVKAERVCRLWKRQSTLADKQHWSRLVPPFVPLSDFPENVILRDLSRVLKLFITNKNQKWKYLWMFFRRASNSKKNPKDSSGWLDLALPSLFSMCPSFDQLDSFVTYSTFDIQWEWKETEELHDDRLGLIISESSWWNEFKVTSYLRLVFQYHEGFLDIHFECDDDKSFWNFECDDDRKY